MYYPDQRYAASLTVIRREAMLPEEALGNVRASEGQRVDIRDVVVNGVIPSQYIILDVMAHFGLKKESQLDDYLQVGRGDVVDAEEPVAYKSARGKKLIAPARGIVSQITGGRIILQEMPDIIDVEAGVRGRVIQVEPGRGVVIEAIGAQTQGVWGNGRRLIATMRAEPAEGLENIQADSLEQRYAGTIVLTRKPLQAAAFAVMDEQLLAGVVAPSMDASLIERALNWDGALLLTEGFGDIRMSSVVFNMLQDFSDQAVTLDAHTPGRFETRTPEVIINVNDRNANPTPPNVQLSLRNGMTVRVTRAPHLGLTGKVADLPKLPTLLPNGLRVPCAKVELVSGETAHIPVANLEVLGR
jgi:hypothetical protein